MQIGVSSKLRVVEINPWEDPRWEAFLMEHPEGTIYHHPAWLKALEREYQQRAVLLACEDDDGTILGILPLLYTRGFPLCGRRPLTGPRLSSLPRTPLAGPLSVDPTVTAELLREALQRTTAQPPLRMQIKAYGGELSGKIDGVVRKPWRESYVVRLAGVSGQAYVIPGSQNRATIRRGINKAAAMGVRTRLADTEADLRVWYGLYLETMRRNFVPARPYRFFLALWELMRSKGMMRLVLAEHHTDAGSRIIAGHLSFSSDTQSLMLSAHRDPVIFLCGPTTRYSGRPSRAPARKDTGLSTLTKSRKAMRAWLGSRVSGAPRPCVYIGITILIFQILDILLKRQNMSRWRWQK